MTFRGTVCDKYCQTISCRVDGSVLSLMKYMVKFEFREMAQILNVLFLSPVFSSRGNAASN